MSRRKAFTLVELLVVVGIIALLVTILMPALQRALALTRKATCAAQLNSFGRAEIMYREDYNSYPPMGDSRFQPWGWPRFYGILQELGIQARRMERGIWDFSEWELDECWEKCFCPAMDYVRIIKAADKALTTNAHPLAKVALHRAAAGYQWNVTLRAAGRPMSACPSGRWSPALWEPNVGWNAYDNTGWINYPIFLPNGRWYICQAVHTDEIAEPAKVADGWDGFDYETLPNLTWPNRTWAREGLCPGWHVGPQSKGTKGWVPLNGFRHPTSPNILYADGHVAADATEELKPSQMGPMPNGGTWKGMKINSWQDYVKTWGTLHHVVPQRAFTKKLE